MSRSIVSSLLPLAPHHFSAPWVLFEIHETTEGIFEEIRRFALEADFEQRDEIRRNVFERDGIEYVGYWCELERINELVDKRRRGFVVTDLEIGGLTDSHELVDVMNAVNGARPLPRCAGCPWAGAGGTACPGRGGFACSEGIDGKARVTS